MLVLAYLEVLPRYSQNRMRSYWDGIANSGTENKLSDKKEQAKQKLLTPEKKGPDNNQLGVIFIPKIKVKQVVLYDATQSNLAIGPSV